MTPFVIGIAGGSCSGKTTLIRKVHATLGETSSAVIFQDSYYIDQSHRFDEDGGSVNFDHPSAIDFDLLANHLKQLKQGQSIEMPQYDFATHSRLSQPITFRPKPIILVDGILILSQPQVLDCFDQTYFIECDQETRLQRRIRRDTTERGRTEAGVIAQFEKQVAPMHEQFVEPSKIHANKLCKQKDLDEAIKVLVQACSDKI